ncbi:hypothetical protein ACJJTC_019495 [Scirpophaga incertulas]
MANVCSNILFKPDIRRPGKLRSLSQYHRVDEYAEELRLAEAYYRGGDFRAAAELATRLLELSPWAAQLRQLRAECYVALVRCPLFLYAYCSDSYLRQLRAECYVALVRCPLFLYAYCSDCISAPATGRVLRRFGEMPSLFICIL